MTACMRHLLNQCVTTVTQNLIIETGLKPAPKTLVTFWLPDGQQDLDLEGEDHGSDDDGGHGGGRDVREVGGEERAGHDYDLNETKKWFNSALQHLFLPPEVKGNSLLLL